MLRTKPDNEQTSPTNSMICGTFFYPLVSVLKYIFSPQKDKVSNLTRTPDKQNPNGLNGYKMLADEPDFQTMTVVFGEPIS